MILKDQLQLLTGLKQGDRGLLMHMITKVMIMIFMHLSFQVIKVKG